MPTMRESPERLVMGPISRARAGRFDEKTISRWSAVSPKARRPRCPSSPEAGRAWPRAIARTRVWQQSEAAARRRSRIGVLPAHRLPREPRRFEVAWPLYGAGRRAVRGRRGEVGSTRRGATRAGASPRGGRCCAFRSGHHGELARLREQDSPLAPDLAVLLEEAALGDPRA